MNIRHNKQEVIQKGIQLFSNYGYHALGIEEICKQTGMTKGAFYNAFKSKENFYLETIAAYNQKNLQRIEDQLKKTDKKAINRLISFYEHMLEVQPILNFTGCYINNTMAEMGNMNELIGEKTCQSYYDFIQAIEPSVLEAQEQGDLCVSFSARQLTLLLHTTFYGVLNTIKSTKDIEEGKKILQTLFTQLKP